MFLVVFFGIHQYQVFFYFFDNCCFLCYCWSFCVFVIVVSLFFVLLLLFWWCCVVVLMLRSLLRKAFEGVCETAVIINNLWAEDYHWLASWHWWWWWWGRRRWWRGKSRWWWRGSRRKKKDKDNDYFKEVWKIWMI